MDKKPMADLKGYLTQDEIRQIYDACLHPHEKVFIRLLWVTGARLSEVLSLRIENVLWKDKMLIIRSLKKRGDKKATRMIPIDAKTLDLLKEYIGGKSTGYVIGKAFGFHENDDPENQELVKKLQMRARGRAFYCVRSVAKRGGIVMVGTKKVHPHHFRHSFAVHWVKTNPGTESLRKLQMVLGHSGIDITSMYLQFSANEMRGDYDKMFEDEDDD